MYKYEFLTILKDGESYISGETLQARVKELNAVGTKEDCDYLLAHPEELEGMKDYYVVFTGYSHPRNPGHVCYVSWYGDRWVESWRWLESAWYGRSRVLRKVSESSATQPLGISQPLLTWNLGTEKENSVTQLKSALDTLTEAIEGVKKYL